MAAPVKLRIVFGANNAEKLTIESGMPKSVEDLSNEIKRQFDIEGDIRLQYMDSDFDNNFVNLKGIVHFEIKIWYLSAYPKGIQDVGVFFSSVDPILMFLGQTVLVCQSYNGRYRSLSL